MIGLQFVSALQFCSKYGNNHLLNSSQLRFLKTRVHEMWVVVQNEPLKISFSPCGTKSRNPFQYKYFIFRAVGSVTQRRMLTSDGNVLPAAVPVGSAEMTPGQVKCGWQCEPEEFNVWAKISSHWAKKKPVLVYTKKHTLTHTRYQSGIAMLMPGPLWACLALIWVGSCSAHSLFTCEPIKVHRCLGMSYNMTFFPNMMEHYDQDIAASNMEVSPPNITYMSLLIHCIVPILALLGINQSTAYTIDVFSWKQIHQTICQNIQLHFLIYTFYVWFSYNFS